MTTTDYLQAPSSEGAGEICLARYWMFEAAGQVLQNLLFALLNFKENRFGEPQIVLLRMNLASLQQDASEIGYALPRQEHLIVSLDLVNSSSTILRFRKLLEV